MSRTLLVIESDPWLGDHYQRLFERHDLTVIRASNAYSAMDMIDDEMPDIIVTNLNLSGSSSVALLHELQTYDDTAHIPIIVCSNIPHLTIEELRPYGVRQLVDSMTMQPSDLLAAVRSVTA